MSATQWTLRESRDPQSAEANFNRPLRAVFQLMPSKQYITLSLTYLHSGHSLIFHEGGNTDNKTQVYAGAEIDDTAAEHICNQFLQQLTVPNATFSYKYLGNHHLTGGALLLFFDLTPTANN